MKKVFKNIFPPFTWNGIFYLKAKVNKYLTSKRVILNKSLADEKQQDLDIYWDPAFAIILDEWGKDSVWNEIQLILANSRGKVLDIACGTGITMKILKIFPKLDIYGFDISELMIESATTKGISKSKLMVSDATNTNYNDNEFDYSYSIGSLEHFTEDGIEKVIYESSRYTKTNSFHMIPVSRSGKNMGWIKNLQSYFNNSEGWWYDKFKKYYSIVYIIPSKWEDNISKGRWFICVK